MVVVWPVPSVVEAVPLMIKQVLDHHKLLSDKIRELAPSVPHDFYSQNAYVYERIIDVRLIFTRLAKNRQLLNMLREKDQRLRPKKQIYKKTLSKKLQIVVDRYHDVHHQMRLDMESLFIFGNLLLEHWARLILYFIGELPGEHLDFVQFMNRMQKKGDKGLLQPLWDNQRKDMLWLLYQIRNYRNIFIEHLRQPVQRGSSMRANGDDFRLSSPTPPDVMTDDQIQEAVRKIRYLAPSWTKTEWYTRYPRSLLEVMFYYIDEIMEQNEREKVWAVWKRVGGWTFSYDIIIYRLMRLMNESSITILDIIAKHPSFVIN